MSHIGKPPCDEGAILYGAKASPYSRAARRWTLIAAVLGSSMAFVDGTVVKVALPAIQRELGATASQAQWVIESYALLLGRRCCWPAVRSATASGGGSCSWRGWDYSARLPWHARSRPRSIG